MSPRGGLSRGREPRPENAQSSIFFFASHAGPEQCPVAEAACDLMQHEAAHPLVTRRRDTIASLS